MFKLIRKWRQKRLLRRIFEALKTPLPDPLEPMQNYDSDPLWKLANSASNFRREYHTSIRELIEKTENMDGKKIDIRQFFGSNNGKSTQRRSLHEFAFEQLQATSKTLYTIGFETDAHWNENIKSFETRFSRSPCEAYYFEWSEKLYLVNGDQSHHFAAIYRQAVTQNKSWEVPCHLRRFAFRYAPKRGEYEFISLDDLSRFTWVTEAEGISVMADELSYFPKIAFCYRVNGIQESLFSWVESELSTLGSKGNVMELKGVEGWIKSVFEKVTP